MEKCWVFILKYFDTSYLIFDSFWWDVPYFFTVPAPHTEKKGFYFYLFLLSSSTTVRKSESQGSLQNPEPGSKSDKQFALWKWLTNASKKEERKTVYFTFFFFHFRKSFSLPRVDSYSRDFCINISILTTSLLSYISKFTGTTEKTYLQLCCIRLPSDNKAG